MQMAQTSERSGTELARNRSGIIEWKPRSGRMGALGGHLSGFWPHY